MCSVVVCPPDSRTADKTNQSPDAVVVRKYAPGDREDVRRIALETADIGAPVDRFLSLQKAMADFLTRYYTDFEPQSAFVADTVPEGSHGVAVTNSFRTY